MGSLSLSIFMDGRYSLYYGDIRCVSFRLVLNEYMSIATITPVIGITF